MSKSAGVLAPQWLLMLAFALHCALAAWRLLRPLRGPRGRLQVGPHGMLAQGAPRGPRGSSPQWGPPHRMSCRLPCPGPALPSLQALWSSGPALPSLQALWSSGPALPCLQALWSSGPALPRLQALWSSGPLVFDLGLLTLMAVATFMLTSYASTASSVQPAAAYNVYDAATTARARWLLPAKDNAAALAAGLGGGAAGRWALPDADGAFDQWAQLMQVRWHGWKGSFVWWPWCCMSRRGHAPPPPFPGWGGGAVGGVGRPFTAGHAQLRQGRARDADGGLAAWCLRLRCRRCTRPPTCGRRMAWCRASCSSCWCSGALLPGDVVCAILGWPASSFPPRRPWPAVVASTPHPLTHPLSPCALQDGGCLELPEPAGHHLGHASAERAGAGPPGAHLCVRHGHAGSAGGHHLWLPRG